MMFQSKENSHVLGKSFSNPPSSAFTPQPCLFLLTQSRLHLHPLLLSPHQLHLLLHMLLPFSIFSHKLFFMAIFSPDLTSKMVFWSETYGKPGWPTGFRIGYQPGRLVSFRKPVGQTGFQSETNLAKWFLQLFAILLNFVCEFFPYFVCELFLNSYGLMQKIMV